MQVVRDTSGPDATFRIIMSTLDWTIVVGYVLALVAIGVITSRRVNDTAQYFLGHRRFGKLLMMAQSFGIGTHADMPVSVAGAVYSNGISAIWYQWKNLFAMPFYWIMAPVFRRVRRTTTAEMVEDRYGVAMGGIYIAFSFAFFVINIASVLKGAAKILYEVLGAQVGVNQILLGLAAIFVLYSFFGGLLASTFSDLLQGALIILLSFMLIPLGWGSVGGLDGIRHSVPSQYLSLATPKEIGLWFILMLTINGVIGIMAQPHMMAAVGTGKDEYACRVGFFHGNLVKRICTIGWAVVGLMVAAMIRRGVFGVHSLGDPEDAFGFASRHLLSSGFRGLLISSVMGAGLATCSALMIDSGALFTQGFYRRSLVTARSERHYLWVGRISGLAVVVVSIAYALFFVQRVLYSFLLTETLATYVGISVVTGLVWRRANRWGAIGSLASSLFMNFFLYHCKGSRPDYWDPNVFLASLAVGILTLIIVSLLTRPEPDMCVRSFFARLETPSDYTPADALPSDALPAGAVTSDVLDLDLSYGKAAVHARPQLLLVNLLHLRRGAGHQSLYKAYGEDIRGLFVGFALSASLVLVLWLVLKV